MLSHLNILVTRPDPQGTELCQSIKVHGGSAIHLPTIVFGPPPDLNALDQAINLLSEQDWLIFISPHAVYASIALIRHKWPQFPSQVKFAAVGAGTAHALKQAGYLVSAHPEIDWGSEGLLALPEFQSLTGKKIAIIRGEGGRELLANTLSDRGAAILPVIAYQRVLPSIDISPYLTLAKEKKVDVIVCTSFEGVKNLKTLFGDAGWLHIKDIPLIVVSERIKMLARDLGFRTIWVARNASREAIIEALEKKE